MQLSLYIFYSGLIPLVKVAPRALAKLCPEPAFPIHMH